MKDKRITVAAIQSSFSPNLKENLQKISDFVRLAASKGAQIILPPELFEGPYFPREEKDEFFLLAKSAAEHPAVLAMQALAKELRVAIPTSFFEREGQNFYNSLAMIDADGAILGIYRKSHIPDGPGYEEKFYFRPGNTGFKSWTTAYATIGVGICWDQWFPECARAMMLLGADLLFYPTAIGSEPQDATADTKDPWQRAMIGHSVSNAAPVIAANRVGNEKGQIFYGSSFITDHRGEKIAELGRSEEGVITANLDLELVRSARASFGFFRDRRPDLYQALIEE
jgi:N-carbamoylputrescine amidase